jgi:hypothetical protein
MPQCRNSSGFKRYFEKNRRSSAIKGIGRTRIICRGWTPLPPFQVQRTLFFSDAGHIGADASEF